MNYISESTEKKDQKTEEKSTTKRKEKREEHPSQITLRNYPKVIFFYPLFFTSLTLWILQMIFASTGTPIALLGFIWMIVFFINLIIIGFDFNSTKFFILVLVIVIVILLFVFLVVPNISLEDIPPPREYNIEMTNQFYLVITILLGLILLFVFIKTRFNYWRIERNEVYHNKGLFVEADRYPTRNMNIKKKIPDVFEYFILRAGSLTLYVEDEDFHLPTVLNIDDKIEKINYLLSHLEVEVDQLD